MLKMFTLLYICNNVYFPIRSILFSIICGDYDSYEIINALGRKHEKHN